MNVINFYEFENENDFNEAVEVETIETEEPTDKTEENEAVVPVEIEAKNNDEIDIIENETNVNEIIEQINTAKKKRGRKKGYKKSNQTTNNNEDTEKEPGATEFIDSNLNNTSDLYYFYANILHNVSFKFLPVLFNSIQKKYVLDINLEDDKIHTLNVLLANILRKRQQVISSEMMYFVSLGVTILASIKKAK